MQGGVGHWRFPVWITAYTEARRSYILALCMVPGYSSKRSVSANSCYCSLHSKMIQIYRTGKFWTMDCILKKTGKEISGELKWERLAAVSSLNSSTQTIWFKHTIFTYSAACLSSIEASPGDESNWWPKETQEMFTAMPGIDRHANICLISKQF